MSAPYFRTSASPLPFAITTILLTGSAVVAGRHLQSIIPSAPSSASTPNTRLAQAGRTPVSRPKTVTARAQTDEADKRLRAASETFSQVYKLVRSEYVDTVPEEQVLSHGAIRAMLSALEDEQSYFVTAAERKVFDAESEGRFDGIGAVTAIRSGKTKGGFTDLRLMVVAPLPNSPAAKAGLMTGDRITHLDGKYILGDNPYLAPNKVPNAYPATVASEGGDDGEEPEPIQDGIGLLVAQMRLRQGTAGTHLLTIQRPGHVNPLRLSIRKARNNAPKLSYRRVTASGKSALYFRIGAFTDESGAEMTSYLRGALPSDGIVLDLRQNPGSGSLTVAENIAAELTHTNEPFAIELGNAGKRTPLPLPNMGHTTGIKRAVSVLTDAGTAGFAEALAARLIDSGATHVGSSRTWGDGRSQTLYPLPDGSAFTLTTGKLVSPKGTAWELVGLAPRVVLPSGIGENDLVARAVTVAGKGGSASVATSELSGESNH